MTNENFECAITEVLEPFIYNAAANEAKRIAEKSKNLKGGKNGHKDVTEAALKNNTIGKFNNTTEYLRNQYKKNRLDRSYKVK